MITKIIHPSATDIQDIFRPLIGLPCWGAARYYGSRSGMEFGRVDEPERISPAYLRALARDPTASKLPKKMLPPRGEWNFALIDAAWRIDVGTIAVDDQLVSDEAIAAALAILDGQALTAVSWDQAAKLLVLSFDGGATIEASVSPLHDADTQVWWLAGPGKIYTIFYADDVLKTAPGEAST